jgi:hypothetical protein
LEVQTHEGLAEQRDDFQGFHAFLEFENFLARFHENSEAKWIQDLTEAG